MTDDIASDAAGSDAAGRPEPLVPQSPAPGLRANPLLRPNGQLFELPPPYWWEVTRRHCYYVALRGDAQRHRRGEPTAGPLDELVGRLASAILRGIGVDGPLLPDPATPYDALADGPDGPFQLGGSVRPVTLRALAAVLLDTLPKADLEIVGHLFRSALLEGNAVEGDDDRRTLRRAEVVEQLDSVPGEALGSIPLTPLFHVHLGASGRTVTRDMEALLKEWRRRLGLPERRVPVQRLGDYLRVWDLREGWTGGGYDRAAEVSLTEISKRLKKARSTVLTQYKEAFRLVTGHPFSPALWLRTFGLYKLNRHLVPSADRTDAPRRRTGDPPPPRPVPESVVAPAPPRGEGDRRAGLVEALSAVAGRDEREEADLRMDLEDLTRRGLSDEAIAAELELENAGEVRWLRDRLCDF